MKVIVVGGVAGGASAAARIRRLDAKAEIKMFERGKYVSFSNCSLPYYLSSVVEDSGDLIMMDPEEFKTKPFLKLLLSSKCIERYIFLSAKEIGKVAGVYDREFGRIK